MKELSNSEVMMKKIGLLGALLVMSGAVAMQNEDTVSKILDAIKLGKVSAVKQFLEGGGDPNSQYHNSTLLIRALSNNQTEIVKLLVAKGADVNLKAHPHAYAPLFAACVYADLELIRFLVEAGADMHTSKSLNAARCAKRLEVVQYLLEHGVNVDEKHCYRMLNSKEFTTVGIVSLLLKRPHLTHLLSSRLLMWAQEHDRDDLLMALPLQKCHVEAVDEKYGATLLMWAAHGGNWALCKKLLHEDASLTARNNQGWTAEQCAWEAGKKHIIEFANAASHFERALCIAKIRRLLATEQFLRGERLSLRRMCAESVKDQIIQGTLLRENFNGWPKDLLEQLGLARLLDEEKVADENDNNE